jgi:biopolymer transport protein ExbD
MRLSGRKVKKGARIELAMTSMIDVIFLLLIFFICTPVARMIEKDLESGIEQAGKGAPGERVDLEPAIVDIVRGEGGFTYQLGTRMVADRKELQALLSQFPNKGDGAFVRVRDDVPFAMVAEAIQVCHDAGFLSVSYLPLAAKK